MGRSKKVILLIKVAGLSLGLFLIGVICAPRVQFDEPYSKVLYAQDGQLLGGKIAADGQWRFPNLDSVPSVYEQALLRFEDSRFHSHIGVDIRSILRATKQNLKEKRIVSGASTLTMQVCRMSRGNRPRNLTQKFIEVMMAIKLELTHSKSEILTLHASHAPYGGNVVGLEAASWRYYSKDPYKLSLGESALLSVLPNAPSLMHPGKNRQALKDKRDRLLKRLLDVGEITELDYDLALLEDIPERPTPLPRLAPHLLESTFSSKNDNYSLKTTIDTRTQEMAIQTTNFHSEIFQQSDIQNMGILILDTQSGEVLAYVGNVPDAQEQQDVDMVRANRSSGSVLKPILYAAAVDDGTISPTAMMKDVPIQFNGYRPLNYNKKFLGAIKADAALAKSLNVPAASLLKEYGVPRFINKLHSLNFKSITKPAEHYGLTLILGGAEVNLWDLTGAYATMGRVLYNFKNNQSRYYLTDLHPPTITKQNISDSTFAYDPDLFSSAAIHHTFSAMKKVSRPDEEGDWQAFEGIRNISWKTGTSFGHRDAWAVGVTPKYTVGVWVGNADGEGKHDLVGVKKAAPVLFDIFNKLDYPGHFEIPYDDLVKTKICRTTGFAAHRNCTEIDTTYQISSAQGHICPYHIKVHLDKEGNRVNSHCTPTSEMNLTSWLVLPADAAFYYAQTHPEYKAIPAYRKDCQPDQDARVMTVVYPKEKAKIYLPIAADGEQESALFKVAHQDPRAKLYWHLNDTYLGMTEGEHHMPVKASYGLQKITVIDNLGHQTEQAFEITGS